MTAVLNILCINLNVYFFYLFLAINHLVLLKIFEKNTENCDTV